LIYGDWVRASVKKPRTLDSVILDGNLAGEITADIDKFLKSAQWYIEKGVPYRRGYPFSGPPGTGKTSFTEVIAGVLGMDVCYLNLGSDNLDDDSVNSALN